MSDQQTLVKKAKQLANTECADWNTNFSASCAMTAVIEMLAKHGMLKEPEVKQAPVKLNTSMGATKS